MHKNKISVLLFTLFISFNGAFGQSNGFEVLKSLELMDQIYQHLEMYYVDEPQPGKISKTGIDAMLKELDPYTVYYHESNIEDYRLMTTGQYGGIGALIRKIDDFTFIAEPYEGNPAHSSGLRAGDKILSIDDKSMKGVASDEVSSALKGPKGTTIKIEIEREKEGKKIISVTRDEIKLADVPYSGMLNSATGYIKLNSFTQTAASEVKTAFTALQGQGMKNLVLDLRGNGGGLLIEAVKIVNMFVKKGETVVTTKGRVAEENRVYQTLENPIDLTIPLTILMDEGSASASEIVAGSIQDLDRGVIIGTTSYGKGLVQRTYDLKYGSKVKLTIAKYYTPSGRCVQRLEYYDKEDGKRPSEIPDSLIKIFKTVNGRDVIDGRGIEPDVKIDEREMSRLTATIYSKNFLFNYATNYFYSHPEIAPAGEFALSDSDYETFKAYVLSQEFTYSTASEEMLKKMKETAEEEGFYEDASAEYEALLTKVHPSKERDLEKFKNEITELLENEIVSRYYFQKGRAKDAFRHDPAVKKAIEVVENVSEYNTILKK
ncbi:MAG: S41 family peptidase [Crocinitomicaceae bacterium]|jgi:carboxyl-terminal processing protease|nr:S41 family peptidase [Crocinitomicaceae bacterium]MDP4866476.1 S41 family peptidase [Crocinitomicaceae bacterium]